MDNKPETHPSFAMARVNTVHANPGVSLFDSDLRHNRYVILSISHAERERNLNHDYIRARDEIIEIAMSSAQWGALVSSFGTEGVPVTISRANRELVPEPEFSPRLAESMAEVRGATNKGAEELRESFAAVREAFDGNTGKKALKAALWSLECSIKNLPLNLDYAADCLTKHAENVVTKARADIEGMVAVAAAQHGIEAPKLPELTT